MKGKRESLVLSMSSWFLRRRENLEIPVIYSCYVCRDSCCNRQVLVVSLSRSTRLEILLRAISIPEEIRVFISVSESDDEHRSTGKTTSQALDISSAGLVFLFFKIQLIKSILSDCHNSKKETKNLSLKISYSTFKRCAENSRKKWNFSRALMLCYSSLQTWRTLMV